jgi:hypothetical protein
LVSNVGVVKYRPLFLPKPWQLGSGDQNPSGGRCVLDRGVLTVKP